MLQIYLSPMVNQNKLECLFRLLFVPNNWDRIKFILTVTNGLAYCDKELITASKVTA